MHRAAQFARKLMHCQAYKLEELAVSALRSGLTRREFGMVAMLIHDEHKEAEADLLPPAHPADLAP
jgi:hypothetical protein